MQMKNNLLIFIIIISIIITPLMTSSCQVLEARIEDSKGIIGLDLTIVYGSVPVVRQIFDSTPAFYAGINVGDKIIKIDNKPTISLTKDEIDLAISDIPGITVNFEIQRDSKRIHKSIKVASLNAFNQKLQQIYLNEE